MKLLKLLSILFKPRINKRTQIYKIGDHELVNMILQDYHIIYRIRNKWLFIFENIFKKHRFRKKVNFYFWRKLMSWHDLIDFEDTYEICDEYPYTIRKKSNGFELKESINQRGYYSVSLNRRHYLKHRIIAKQFIKNPNNYNCVDHMNRDRTDNHISNLKWASHSINSRNKSSNCGVEYVYINYDEAPRDLIIVTDYGNHEFVDYYYSPSNELFYYDNDSQLRILHINIYRNIYKYVKLLDVNNKRVNIL